MKDLKELNEELENYFRNTVIPQLFIDANFILRKFTPPAMKLFNLSNRDLGKHLDDISDNIRYPTFMENIKEVIESQEDFEKEIQTTDMNWYQMNILPYIVRKEGRSNGVIITFVDITDRIETLKAFEKLNRNFENIFYTVSHDLRGPVGNIESLIKLLEDVDDIKSEDSKEILDSLVESVTNLKQTISDLTDKSDVMDSKSPEKGLGKVHLQQIIHEVRLSLKDKISKSNAVIKTDFDIPDIKYVRRKIRSILYNLVSNAIKYATSEEIPTICIKTEKVNEFIVLTVQDNGIGIAEDKHDTVFARYARISDEVEGTGVGLFIVKSMVEDSGGKIEVESALGKGSTFKVYIKE